jgi:hypothetical protein
MTVHNISATHMREKTAQSWNAQFKFMPLHITAVHLAVALYSLVHSKYVGQML